MSGVVDGAGHDTLRVPIVSGFVTDRTDLRKSWEMGRFTLTWWHLRCRRVRLAWLVLRG